MVNFKYKTKPFGHQHTIFQKLKDTFNHAIFWEMGTGKSKFSIDLFRYKCYLEKRVIRTLIIAPKVSLFNWREEFYKHSNVGKKVNVLAKRKDIARKQRLRILNDPRACIFVINYEGLNSVKDELIAMKWDMIILDESHRIKKHDGKTTGIVNKLAGAKFKYILSGTPVLNNPLDLFSQFYFLDKGETLGTDEYFVFKHKYFHDKNAGFKHKPQYFPKWEPMKGCVDILNEMIQSKASIVKKAECLDLPAKIYKVPELTMAKDQKAMYDDLIRDSISLIDGYEDAVVANTAFTQIIRLLQITSGFYKTDEGAEVRFKKNPKFDYVKSVLEQLTPDHKIIIWAVWRNNIFMLQEKFKKYNPAVIFGDTKDKFAEEKKFRNNKNCRIMIANPASAGIAINLVEASYAIYYSQNYKWGDRAQSEDRCHRIGSEQHDKITYLDPIFPNTIDSIVLEALKNKNDMSKNLIKVLETLREW